MKGYRAASTDLTEKSVAPCGVICDLCLAFQREKNRCSGCRSDSNKLGHCTRCSILLCEKKAEKYSLCVSCSKFPCRRIRTLNKRYTEKYGMSPVENMLEINRDGMDVFLAKARIRWKCPECGMLLSVHRDTCLSCGAVNSSYPSDPPE